MTDSLRDMSPTARADFVRTFCGERLGGGMSREAYVFEPDPSKVVKIEDAAGSFQNVVEWETWRALRDTKHARWLAPCRLIGPTGCVLLMDRTTPLRAGEEPDSLPAWLSDHKRQNYGVLDGRVVCHDYGTNLLLNHGAFGKRDRKPHWHD